MEFLLFKLYVGDFPKLHVQNFLLDAKMALNSAAYEDPFLDQYSGSGLRICRQPDPIRRPKLFPGKSASSIHAPI